MDTKITSDQRISFGAFEFDLDALVLYRKGNPAWLQHKAAQLLKLLIENHQRVVTMEEIRSAIWPGDRAEDLDKRIYNEVRQIRRVLQDDREKPVFIATFAKAGYKFIYPVKGVVPLETSAQVPVYEAEGAPIPGNKYALAALAQKKRTLKSLHVALVVVFAVVAVVVGFGSHRFRGRIGQTSTQLATGAADEPVAGVPFVTAVSPIQAEQIQRIVIVGHGLGHFTPFSNLDTPFLAIVDDTAHWVAGRIQPANADDVTLTVGTWTNSHIEVEGFGGLYRSNGWELHPGDLIEVDVWNPQTGAGPARFRLHVTRTGSLR